MTSTFKPGGLLDRGGQFLAIHCLARGAGGDDADRDGLRFAGHGREIGYGLGRGGDRLGLQAMRLVEAVPEAGLFALLATGRISWPATSATNSFTELVPTSITARRMGCMGRIERCRARCTSCPSCGACHQATEEHSARAPRKQAGGLLQGFLA